MGGNIQKIRPISNDIPFYFLEDWSKNSEYDGEDIQYIKQFHEIKQLTKGWIENEGLKF
jgi:hypothetical protein